MLSTIVSFWNILNNRERSLIIWLIVILFWALLNKDIRSSIGGVVRAFFAWKMIAMFAIMFLYIFLMVFSLQKVGFWEYTLSKDLMAWFMGTALAMFMNANKVSEDPRNFKKLITDNIKWIIILEFIINLNSFSLWAELLLLPVITLLVLFGTVAGMDEKTQIVKKITDFMLAIIGFTYLGITIASIVNNPKEFETITNLKSFIIHPLLTVGFLPLIYVLALLMAYEILFLRVGFLVSDEINRKLAKKGIFKSCRFSLSKLNRFSKNYMHKLGGSSKKGEVQALLNDFNSEEASVLMGNQGSRS